MIADMKHESKVGLIDRDIGKNPRIIFICQDFQCFYRALLEGSEEICFKDSEGLWFWPEVRRKHSR